MRGVTEFIRRSTERRAELKQQSGALSELSSASHRVAVERAREGVRAQLGEGLLPDLSDAACQRAAAWVGFPAILGASSPAVERAAERAQLEAELAALEADPDWSGRETLVHPETGTLSIEEKELEERRAPAWEVNSLCFQSPRFQRLIDTGYDTPEYAVPFWRAAYYQDWEAADLVVERFLPRQQNPKLRFSDVRALFLEVQDSVQALDASLSSVRGKLRRIRGLEERHVSQREALETLEARHLDRWRKRLVSHVEALGLEHQDPALLSQPELARLVKVLDGLGAKLRTLEELGRTASTLAGELDAERNKLLAEENKLRRPKNAGTRFTEEELSRRFDARSAKQTKRVGALLDTGRRVKRYDRWDDAPIGGSYDWGAAMTGASVGVAAYALLDSHAAAASVATHGQPSTTFDAS